MIVESKTTKAAVHDAPLVKRTKTGKVIVKASQTHESASSRRQRLSRGRTAAVTVGLLFAVSAALATWLYVWQYRPDERTDPGAQTAVLNAARDGTVAMLSYSPTTLDRDFASAKSHLTGDFLAYYDQFTQQIVTPAAKEKALTTTAQVMGAAVSELHSSSAVVLVFVNQSTTSKERPDPTMAASSVMVSLNRVDGKWLITKFDPV